MGNGIEATVLEPSGRERTSRLSAVGKAIRALPLALVAGWPLAFYWRAFLGFGIFYFGDIARFFYPTRLLYANALQQGRLPLWVPQILAGFPLFAEMQTGALYPPHLLLYRLLPIDIAINYDILFHLSLLAAGMYLFARSRGVSQVGSVISAMALSAGGFGVGRVTHMSVIAVAAWLPLTLLVYDKWRQTPRLGWWLLLVILFAVQLIAGHPQFMLLNLLTFCAYMLAAWLGLLDGSSESSHANRTRRAIIAFLPALAVALAICIAAIQLLPTLELSGATARAGGVDEAFFTQFSYHPLFLSLLLEPFILGNPYPRVSVEVVAYLGIMPLLLVFVAVLLRRDRNLLFWGAFALVCFSLALGGFNPIYRLLRFVPLFNLFRVPARFLFPMMLSLSVLAGMGYDALWTRARADSSGWLPRVIAILSATLAAAVILFGSYFNADEWVQAWRLLSPIFFATSAWVLIRSARAKFGRAALSAAAVGLTLLDLAAFGTVYAETFNVIAPEAEVFARPRVLDNLNLDAGKRILTSQWVFPWVSVMRESLYPNLNAAFDVNSPLGYTPLEPVRTEAVLSNLSSQLLNLLNVRYYLIPQVLPVDAESEGHDLADPFNLNPVDAPISFPPTQATGIRVESSLAQSAALTNGTTVANVKMSTIDGKIISLPLRAGIETAEWAYDRTDVRKAIKHSEPPIASTFPAQSAFPPEDHPGHTYLADLTFSDVPVAINRILIEPASNFPAGLIHIQSVALANGSSLVDIAGLVGESNHRLVYRSEDVAVFENQAAGPKAFLSHNASVITDEEALKLLSSPVVSGSLFLADGQPLSGPTGTLTGEKVSIIRNDPESVVIDVAVSQDAYLVLTDAWDPGWVATVDGQSTDIRRADVILRAIRVSPGNHRINFSYEPRSFFIGELISIVGLLILAVIAAFGWLFIRLRNRAVI